MAPGPSTLEPRVVDDPAKQLEQQNAQLRELRSGLYRLCPLLEGKLVEGVEVLPAGAAVEHTTAPNGSPVRHQLNRPAKGWLVVRSSADARVWEIGGRYDKSPDTRDLNRAPEGQLLLRSSAPVTLDLWVF